MATKRKPDHPTWTVAVAVRRRDEGQDISWQFAVRAPTWVQAQRKVLQLAQSRYRKTYGNWAGQPYSIAIGAMQKWDAVA